MANDKELVKKTLKRRDMLMERRGQFMNHWEDLSQVMLTRREGFTSTTVDGDIRNEDIYDGTPMQGARSLANTTGAMIRPEGEVFVRVGVQDDKVSENEEAAIWLADATERLDLAIRNPKARFRQATGEVDKDLVVFGTGILFAGLAQSREHLLFKSIHLKDGIPFFNDEGRVVGMFLNKNMMIWQAIEMFGIERLHPKTQEKAAKGKLDEKMRVVHAVVPREQQRFGSPKLARNFPFADMWIEVEHEHLIKSGGFEEFPFIVPRWDTSSGEDYGRSPGMIALPDANTLQAMGETILVSGQRAADPPLMVPEDGAFNEINTFPGGISYYNAESAAALNGRNPFFPLITGSNLPITRDMQSDTRTQVMNAFFKNILNLPVGGPEMTATEIIQRKDEFIREVGPVFGIFETDYNTPMAERAFNTMLRNGGFAPIPEVLAGQEIKFNFELPVTKIRKQVIAAATREWVREQMELGAVDPSHMHIVNKEAAARFSHEALGLPIEIITPKSKYDEKIAADAAAAKIRAQKELENSTADTMQKGAKGMKDLGTIGEGAENLIPQGA